MNKLKYTLLSFLLFLQEPLEAVKTPSGRGFVEERRGVVRGHIAKAIRKEKVNQRTASKILLHITKDAEKAKIKREVMPTFGSCVDNDPKSGLPYYTHSSQSAFDFSTFSKANPKYKKKDQYAIFTPSHRSSVDIVHPVDISASSQQMAPDPNQGVGIKRSTKKILSEGLKKVKTPREWPWTVHGRLSMRFYDCFYMGTGIVIGDRYVLTAAHNLFHPGHKSAPQKITFYTGIEKKSGKDLSWSSKTIAFIPHLKYVENVKANAMVEAEKYDIGLLVLEKPLGTKTGMFDYAEWGKKDSNVNVRLSGYAPKFELGRYLYTMDGPVQKVSKHQIAYKILTAKGHSGSGIHKPDEQIVRCVHAYEGDGEINRGTKITRELKGWIDKLIKLIEYEYK